MRFRLLLIALMSAAPALIQAKNPTILIKDPNDPATPITSNTFAFGSNPNGGGYFFFQNVSGQDWNTLTVTATLPDLTPITCGPGPFERCTVSEKPVSAGFLYNILFGPSSTGGVLNGETFIVDLNDSTTDTDPNGAGSWPTDTDFGAKANYVAPEPATWGLLLSAGFFGLAFRRRRAV